MIRSKQPAASLFSSILVSSHRVSLQFKWRSHKIILTRLHHERIPVLFYQRKYFHMVINFSIAVQDSAMFILTSSPVDKVLLPGYMNCWLLLGKKWRIHKRRSPIDMPVMANQPKLTFVSCDHWIPSRRLTKNDNPLGRIVREPRETVLSVCFDDNDSFYILTLNKTEGKRK